MLDSSQILISLIKLTTRDVKWARSVRNSTVVNGPWPGPASQWQGGHGWARHDTERPVKRHGIFDIFSLNIKNSLLILYYFTIQKGCKGFEGIILKKLRIEMIQIVLSSME